MDIASAYDSPWLIAVNRVLLRLPVPRHSPCALFSLTFSDPFLLRFEFFFHSFQNSSITLFLSFVTLFLDGMLQTFLSLSLFSLYSVFKVRFLRTFLNPNFNSLFLNCSNPYLKKLKKLLLCYQFFSSLKNWWALRNTFCFCLYQNFSF